jgi:hypothetical protein
MQPSGTRLHHRLLRRWYLTILGLLATAGLCFVAVTLVPATHQAEANILLTPPTDTSGPNPNPYFELGGLQPLADILGRALSTSTTVAQLHGEGFAGTYTVIRDQTTGAPILVATVDDTSARLAMNDLRLLLRAAPPTLSKLQADESVPPADQIKTLVITRPTKASREIKSRTRALVVAAAVGLIGTALVVSGVDALLRRRQVRRGEAADASLKSHDDADGSEHTPAAVVQRSESDTSEDHAGNGRSGALRRRVDTSASNGAPGKVRRPLQ